MFNNSRIDSSKFDNQSNPKLRGGVSSLSIKIAKGSEGRTSEQPKNINSFSNHKNNSNNENALSLPKGTKNITHISP
jgi:hypothetical protein